MVLLVPAIYMLQIYDRVLMSRNEYTLLMLTLIMLGLYALMALSVACAWRMPCSLRQTGWRAGAAAAMLRVLAHGLVGRLQVYVMDARPNQAGKRCQERLAFAQRRRDPPRGGLSHRVDSSG